MADSRSARLLVSASRSLETPIITLSLWTFPECLLGVGPAAPVGEGGGGGRNVGPGESHSHLTPPERTWSSSTS